MFYSLEGGNVLPLPYKYPLPFGSMFQILPNKGNTLPSLVGGPSYLLLTGEDTLLILL